MMLFIIKMATELGLFYAKIDGFSLFNAAIVNGVCNTGVISSNPVPNTQKQGHSYLQKMPLLIFL